MVGWWFPYFPWLCAEAEGPPPILGDKVTGFWTITCGATIHCSYDLSLASQHIRDTLSRWGRVLCFSPQGLAREYPEAIKGWAILRSQFIGIGERRGEEKGVSLSTKFERGKGRDWRKARFFLLLFLLKKK